MKTKSIYLFTCLAFFLSACVGININSRPNETKDLVIEHRILNSSFSGVSANNGFNVVMMHGPVERVEVQAEAKVLPYIETTVRNGILSLIVKGHIQSTKPINIYVTYTNLHTIEASTHSKIEIHSLLKNNTTTLNANTGASIDIQQIDSDIILARCNSSVRIAGQAGFLHVISSGGTMDAKNLNTRNLEADLKNRSNLSIHVMENIQAYVSENSLLNFFGNPAFVNIEREKDSKRRGHDGNGSGVR